MVAGTTREVASADAVRAIADVHGVEEGTFSIIPFFPENFIIHCRTHKTRDRILDASPVPAAGTNLVLRPWTRLAHADSAALLCKVALELEGIPAHAWSEDTASKILASSC